jgi:hypothetical protein
MITKLLKNNADMLSMLFFGLGEDKNVINEDHNKDISSSKKIEFIKYMKYAGALVNPKDITVYS